MEESQDILLEMVMSQLNERMISRTILRIEKPTVFITLPDSNVKIWDSIYDSGLFLFNGRGIIVPNRQMRIVNRTFNGREYALDARRQFQLRAEHGKRFRILHTFNHLKDIDPQRSKDYYFYDLSLYSQALKHFTEARGPRMAIRRILPLISREYKKLKQKYPHITFELLWLMKNTSGALFDVIDNIRTFLPRRMVREMPLYDNFLLVSNSNRAIIPILYKDRGKNEFAWANINRLESYLHVHETADQLKKETPVSDTPEEPEVSELETEKSPFEKIAQNLQTAKAVTGEVDEDALKVKLDNKKLASILRKYKIKDPDIVANVRASLDQYIQTKGEKLTQEEAEKTVFNAVHYSIYGTDEVDPSFLSNPEKLLKKLEHVRAHQTPLLFDENTKTANLINPKDIIDIDHTTGVWRQKEEFEKTIHNNIKKLFKSLEQVSDNPINIKKMEHEVVDDDVNRYIRYKVTLQNTAGGKQEEYSVYLNIPTVVNDRYLKLNGVTYIMPVQQFMKPVTKTNKEEVRVLTSHNTVSIKLKNMKFTPVEVKKIINYIQLKYPEVIKEYQEDEYVHFQDDSVIYLNGNTVYESPIRKIIYDNERQVLTDQDGNTIKEKKNEFIYSTLIEKIQSVNPQDKLGRTSKSIPYFSVYIGGFELPFIIYLWQQKGLLSALNDFGVDYEISNNIDDSNYTIRHNNQYLVIKPETKKEELFCNGLLSFKVNKNIEDLNDPTQIHDLIDRNLGQNAVYNMRQINENIIDPIAKELLEFEGLPTSLSNLLTNTAIDKIMDDQIDSLADLKIYRGRLSEMFLHMMYNQLKMAHSNYRKKLIQGYDDAKIDLYDNFIIDKIYEHPGVLNYTEPTNPVDEIGLGSKTIKIGPGGVPSKVSFKKEHRNIHESHIGNMGANATSESSNVGLDVAHTMTCAIMNEFGSYGRKNPEGLSGWNTLSLTEALTPFMNEIDSDRMVMANVHSKQVTPTNGNEPPLIGTGAEYITTQLSSRRFVQKAKKDGIVKEVVPNKYITVEYKNGKTETFDIYPRLSKTKMNNFISLEMNTLQEGDKVSKEQPVAWTKNFNKNGMYCAGKNSRAAIMQYDGLSHEDAYCVSESFGNTMTRDILREVSVVIPPETKIIQLEKEVGKQVSHDDILVEFDYQEDLETYLNVYDLEQADDEDSVEEGTYRAGDNSIKTMGKNGVISDVRVFINNKNLVDKQIVQFHKDLVEDTKNTVGKIAASYDNEDERVKAGDNIPLKFTKIGGHKLKGGAEFTGARIVYYIKQEIPLMIGDKIATRSGAKGVISRILEKENTPYSNTGGIDVFISPTTVFSRKNLTILKELYLGKIIKHLDETIKEMAKNTRIQTNEISKLIYDVFNALGSKETKNAIKNFMKGLTENKLRKKLKENQLSLFFPVPPFSKLEFDKIYEVANLLEIELDEYVYIPEYERYTKKKVPVGILYYQALEQTSDVYASARSTASYQQMTGQPTKGKSRGGGQSVGQLDVNALLTLNSPAVVEELLTLRSDQHQTKRGVINTIINNGTANLPRATRAGETKNMLDVFMTSMGLFAR